MPKPRKLLAASRLLCGPSAIAPCCSGEGPEDGATVYRWLGEHVLVQGRGSFGGSQGNRHCHAGNPGLSGLHSRCLPQLQRQRSDPQLPDSRTASASIRGSIAAPAAGASTAKSGTCAGIKIPLLEWTQQGSARARRATRSSGPLPAVVFGLLSQRAVLRVGWARQAVKLVTQHPAKEPASG